MISLFISICLFCVASLLMRWAIMVHATSKFLCLILVPGLPHIYINSLEWLRDVFPCPFWHNYDLLAPTFPIPLPSLCVYEKSRAAFWLYVLAFFFFSILLNTSPSLTCHSIVFSGSFSRTIFLLPQVSFSPLREMSIVHCHRGGLMLCNVSKQFSLLIFPNFS